MTDPRRPTDATFTIDESRAVPTAVVRASDITQDDVAPLFDAAFGAMFPALAAVGQSPAGAPFALYPRAADDWSRFDIEIGVPLHSPLADTIAAPTADGRNLAVEPSELPAGKVASTLHRGDYDGLGPAWRSFTDELVAAGHTPTLPRWEVYLTAPTPDSDPADASTGMNTRVE
ncbi:GyrI-like domain-containing protein [Corynebacterium freneyi]|uniref:Effector-binding domain-containing protein n=1 Tax=Corynebacterium freneyi TaxID=134034 RepID=A0ABS4U4C2_9CORY|nr:GyrI-like domain-containing protein [Corynebacterium freneyi]MBP2331500.1 effector-binding domain-containing protein [Corynebacterium freneyi]QXA52028.1 transcriptional regulator [Corynebacterium freneyi]UBI02250.1 transcriptional regulator [Corynebacterium freneyi]WJZ06377.1 Bacterial transcription activator, effector binding domain [Corynebacterium freneyi]